jgi:cytoskeletal protein RodZ
MVEVEETETALFPERVGDRLRTARINAGLDLADVATRTRIPLRHLTAIEAGDYASLPAITYCIGFVKAYARTVGQDEVALARDLRSELGMEGREGGIDHTDYDAADPARVPPWKLVLTALGIFALLGTAYMMWRSGTFDGIGQTTTPVAEADTGEVNAAAPVAGAPKAVPAAGQVVLTATEDVWFRVYDRTDKVLFEGVKKKGEAYLVPADADKPMIRTGRADQIKVTVANVEVPPVGPAERTVKDVEITAAALAARKTDAPGLGNTAASASAAAPTP